MLFSSSFSIQAPVFGEIGEMILGKVETKQNETTIFKSLGKRNIVTIVDELK